MIIGLLVMTVALSIPFLSGRIRANRRLSQAVILVLILHQAASFGQVHFKGLPTVSQDAMNFYNFCAHNYGPLVRTPYGIFLRTIFRTFGPSLLLGCELSQVAYSIALVVEVELIYFFGLHEHAAKLILAFGMLPSCILNTSVTTREAYQTMAYLSLCLVAVRTVRDGMSPGRIVAGVVSTVLLVLLHQGFGLLVMMLAAMWLAVLGSKNPKALAACLLVGVVLLAKAAPVWSALAAHSTVFHRVEQGKGLQYIGGYQRSVETSRSTFGVLLNLSSVGSAIRTAPIVLVEYLFSPLPWQIRGFIDVYGFLECAVRMVFFWGMIAGLRRAPRALRREYLGTVGMYALVEIMWAAGTANWGTAFRHRVVAYGILVVLGGVGLFRADPRRGAQANRARPGRRRGRDAAPTRKGPGKTRRGLHRT